MPPPSEVAKIIRNELSALEAASLLTTPMSIDIIRSQAQNQYYEESIAEGVPPLRMMRIPAGSFLMGSPEDELARFDREGPLHQVSLPKFFMAKYCVTQAQWQAVAAMPPVNRTLKPDPARFKGDRLPVEQVSWYDAVEFCDRLSRFAENRISRHTKHIYRLPAEAEWEYACRAGTITPFHFGPTISTEVANYKGNGKGYGVDINDLNGIDREQPVAIDHFGVANNFGLCDMHGNVWEWCQDSWREAYDSNLAKRKKKSARQPDQSDHRVARGGSWYSTPEKCRAASRFHFLPNTSHPDLGFRVICALP